MNTLLFILLVLIAISSYAEGFLFSFKERYKEEWLPKLFKDGVKPALWGLSRQVNHDKYELSRQVRLYTVITFLIISILCVILHAEIVTINLWEYLIVLVATALLPGVFGYYCGKPYCDKKVRKECTKHGIDIPELWKNPQGSLGDFLF